MEKKTDSVQSELVELFLKLTEPEAVAARKRRVFKRRRYWTAGVNDSWAFDQHDKMKRFGLWFNLGLDVCSGKILFIKIWWNNRNPRLVGSYYLDAVEKIGGMHCTGVA